MTTMKRTILATTLALPLLTLACNRGLDTLDTRTFLVQHLQPHEVHALLEPYVYADRTGAPGTMSASAGAVTVRETPDNLDKITRVLEEFDVSRPDMRLTFQLIEANGFTDSDPRIAEVEEELRKVFQFRGYRLAGEALVTATDGSDIGQTLSGTDGMYGVEGAVRWVQSNVIRLEVSLSSRTGDASLNTTVNIREGQTLVIGTSSKRGTTATLLLTVTAGAAEAA
jgi:hypothetical protein